MAKKTEKPESNLVKMSDGVNTADVHPNQVGTFVEGGWKVVK
jgi:hypothetical protein